MTVWITKYALTSGIEEIEVAMSHFSDHVIVEGKIGSRFCRMFHGEGKEWHRTQRGAVERAEEMRVKRLTYLRQQLSRVENLNF